MKLFRRLKQRDLPQTRLYPHDRDIWPWQFPTGTWLSKRLEQVRRQKIAVERI